MSFLWFPLTEKISFLLSNRTLNIWPPKLAKYTIQQTPQLFPLNVNSTKLNQNGLFLQIDVLITFFGHLKNSDIIPNLGQWMSTRLLLNWTLCFSHVLKSPCFGPQSIFWRIFWMSLKIFFWIPIFSILIFDEIQ